MCVYGALCSFKHQDVFTPMLSLKLDVGFVFYVDFWFSIGWIMDSDFSMWWWSQCIDYCIQLHFVPSCRGTSRSKCGSSDEAVWSRYCLSSCHSLPGMMCFVHRAVILEESSGEHMKEKLSSGPFFALFPFIKKVLVLRSIACCHKIEMLVVCIMWCDNLGFNLCHMACTENFGNLCMWHGNWDSAVGIGSSCGLVSLGLKSWHRQRFACLKNHPEPTQPPVTWVLGSLSMGKVVRAWSWLLAYI